MLTFLKKKKCLLTIGLQLSEDNLSLLVLNHAKYDSPVIKYYVNYVIDSQNTLATIQHKIMQFIRDKQLGMAACCLVLDDSDYQLLSIEAPPVTESEMAEAVKWKIKDLLSFPVSEAIIDVFLQKDGQVKNRYIANVVVAQKSLVDKKTQYIESLGLRLDAIDIPELACRNYIERSDCRDKNIAFVLLKKNYGKLVILKEGSVYFSRGFTVDYKGGLFDDLPESDIVLELQRSLDYYERQLKQAVPSEIVIVGENIIEDKITEITTTSLNQLVSIDDMSGSLFSDYTFSDEDGLASARVITLYGAALRQGLVQGGRA
ncbi:MAG: MSHA biogenesis protein MshI [Candidatus Endobugula sp.]|jgi:MSHA biogenesis protein MshI